MNAVTKKIREITDVRVGRMLRSKGFHRHSTHFARELDESLHIVNIQSSQWNTQASGKFTLNVGVHFPKVAKLIYGANPMPKAPKEYHCLLRARIGFLMPEVRDHWWTVTSETNISEMSKEVIRAIEDFVLPWLENFRTIGAAKWTRQVGFMQHILAPAAASLALDNRAEAARLVETELDSIRSDVESGKRDDCSSSRTVALLRDWAAKQGLNLKNLRAEARK